MAGKWSVMRSGPLPVIPEPARNLYAFFPWRYRYFLYWRERSVSTLRDDVNVEVRDRLKGGDAIVLLDQDTVWIERRSDGPRSSRNRLTNCDLFLWREVEDGFDVPSRRDEGVPCHPPERSWGKKHAHCIVLANDRRWTVPGEAPGEVLAVRAQITLRDCQWH